VFIAKKLISDRKCHVFIYQTLSFFAANLKQYCPLLNGFLARISVMIIVTIMSAQITFKSLADDLIKTWFFPAFAIYN